ncbi:MAG: hypothetical protein R3E32_11030 [Chitinophagales bacterium]
MKLTIEIANPAEVEQLLRVFKTLNLESIHVVVDRNVNRKTDAITDLLTTINRPLKK